MPTRAMRETLESRESRSSMDQLLRASHEDDELEHDVTSSTCGSFLCARGKVTCFQLLVAVLTLTACAAGFGRLGYVNGRGTIGDALAMKTSVHYMEELWVAAYKRTEMKFSLASSATGRPRTGPSPRADGFVAADECNSTRVDGHVP